MLLQSVTLLPFLAMIQLSSDVYTHSVPGSIYTHSTTTCTQCSIHSNKFVYHVHSFCCLHTLGHDSSLCAWPAYICDYL